MEPEGLSNQEFKSLAGLVYEKTGIALSDSKKPLVTSRLQKRLRKHGLDSFGAYYDFVLDHAEEVEELINCITTNKTDFFREEVQFTYLRDTLLPLLKASRRSRLRLWSAAASTGEEAYTLAMTVWGALPDPERWDVRILGTDIDTAVLAKARAGFYSADRVEQLPTNLLDRHFERADGGYVVRPHLKKWVDFRQMNLTAERWPLKQQFDAVFCRNVMIYFDQPTKDRLVRKFVKHVAPDGRLFVGLSEAIYWTHDVWRPVGPSTYEHVNQPGSPDATPNTEPPAPAASAPPRPSRPSRNRPPGTEGLPMTRIIVGEVEARTEPAVLSTLLGSCVAIGLYDPQRGIGGLNHFLLPSTSEVTEERAASYGAWAIELLINKLLTLGANRSDLRAKIFGGGRMLQSRGVNEIGASNLAFARSFLENDGIPVTAVCEGGECGLDVTFLTATGQAFTRPIPMTQLRAVSMLDEKQLARVSHEPVAPDNDVELF